MHNAKSKLLRESVRDGLLALMRQTTDDANRTRNKFARSGSFFCSGHIRKARQAKDHAEALPMRPGTPPLTCPFREIQVAGYAHLHTTLNKSRDEKLKSRRVGRGSDFGGRAGVMGWRRPTGKHSRAGSRIDASKMAPPPGLEPGTYRLTAERSAN